MADDLREKLLGFQKDGSRAERALAGYMLSSLSRLPFETAASLALSVGVSEPTVGRFCRALGYHSFRHLKESLRDDIGDHPWLIRDRLDEFRQKARESEPQLSRGLELEIAGIVAVYEQARSPQWAEVVARLASVPRIFVAGFQTERGHAQYFANQLTYLRDGVQLVDLSAGNFAEVLLGEGERALVLFEARHYARHARLLAEAARAQGVPVTLITDRYCDWGPSLCNEVFAVATQFNQFWDSTAHMGCLGNLLINSVFTALGEGVEERVRRTSELYGRFTGHVGNPLSHLAK
ncbi:MurR/RpiR family transcriptional regulator [Roseibium aestuarii]|uniref:MurR/RpiR family transcriptional regulator n=1 Tax=Roseibium aestuarii TaxID=2600299 RepID=A0ABW4JVV8_9HYPH|nr:MurR/RpiR family transcriptional regulator [Roseibium aestuarii]